MPAFRRKLSTNGHWDPLDWILAFRSHHAVEHVRKGLLEGKIVADLWSLPAVADADLVQQAQTYAGGGPAHKMLSARSATMLRVRGHDPLLEVTIDDYGKPDVVSRDQKILVECGGYPDGHYKLFSALEDPGRYICLVPFEAESAVFSFAWCFMAPDGYGRPPPHPCGCGFHNDEVDHSCEQVRLDRLTVRAEQATYDLERGCAEVVGVIDRLNEVLSSLKNVRDEAEGAQKALLEYRRQRRGEAYPVDEWDQREFYRLCKKFRGS